jgi:hypothetical protein
VAVAVAPALPAPSPARPDSAGARQGRDILVTAALVDSDGTGARVRCCEPVGLVALQLLILELGSEEVGLVACGDRARAVGGAQWDRVFVHSPRYAKIPDLRVQG